MTDYARARKGMVDNQLRTAGITDRRLLVAMGDVPREQFVPEVRRGLAYIDEAIAVGGARKLGPPAPFAKLVQLAEVDGTDHVLDLGCGTGVESVPDGLFGQLKPEGRLVALVAERGRPAVAHLFARSGKGIAARPAFDAQLPPLQARPDDRFVF